MDSLEDLLKKAGLPFEKIKGSTKRAEVLEALAKRAKIDADVVQVAMWETEWDEIVAQEEEEKKEEDPLVEFTDPVKRTVLKFMKAESGTRGICYAVNGKPRDPLFTIRLSVHSKGPRLEFPELSTAATVPWGEEQEVLKRLRTLAESRGVVHNIPADGIVCKPEKKTKQEQPPSPPPPQPEVHRRTIVAVENEVIHIKPGWIHSLVSATYGDGYHNVACLGGVAAMVNQGGLTLQVNAMNLNVPDPSPNGAKKLEITYVPTHGAHVKPHYLSSPNQSMPTFDAGVIPDEEEDCLTEKSNASYRHDPYNPTTNSLPCDSCTDDISDISYDSLSRRPSETEDLARYASPPNRPNRAHVSAASGEILAVKPNTIARVVRAVYGEGDRWVLATRVVKKSVHNGGIAGLPVTEESLDVQDPAPGVTKRLVLVYRPVDIQSPIPQASSPPSSLSYHPQQQLGVQPPTPRGVEELPRFVPISPGSSCSLSQYYVRAPSVMSLTSNEELPTLDESYEGGSELSAKGESFIVLVQFRRGRIASFTGSENTPHGTHVIVEGDRGEDLGMVLEARPAGTVDQGKTFPSMVRAATQQEVDRWSHVLPGMEQEAMVDCQEILNRLGGEQMTIAEAEYQFDMNKLTFYFTSKESHPNFSAVLAECFARWHCRIWFSRFNPREGRDSRWSGGKRRPSIPEAASSTPPPFAPSCSSSCSSV